MAYFRFSGVEHGLFSIFGRRTWPIFDFPASNMVDFRFGKIEHGLFSIFGRRTWPIFDFPASNIAYFRFSGVEHGLFSIFGRRTWPIFDFEGIFQFRGTSGPQLPELRSVGCLRYFSDPEKRSVR